MNLRHVARGLAAWSILGILAAGSAAAQRHGGGHHHGGGGSHHHHSHGGGGFRPSYGIGFGTGYYGSGFSISVGRPYGYGYGYPYGGYYGYRIPRYYAPTYIQPAPVYVQQSPVYAVPAAPVSTGEVAIQFPAGGQEAVLDYTLNGIPYSMQTGQTQRFPNDRTWIIEFDRGGAFGRARYTLSPGTFRFKLTDGGWELMRAASDQPALPQ